MKNLTPERREELRKPPSGLDGWLHGGLGGSVSMTRGELMSLLAASELLDAALAENRAWRAGMEITNDPNIAALAIVRARKDFNTTAARLGWEMEEGR